jgi:2,4-dienoyl-CoA reductase-like NADH-dependent reductase (Old Yellow Enzyme family)/thioredoxin reductase
MPFEHLLREGRINQMRTKNRILMGPMERGMANRDGTLTQRYIDFSVERARGGASLVNLEAAYVDARGKEDSYQVGCHTDAVIPGLRRLTSAVHAEGGKVCVELNFGGRNVAATASRRQPLAPSAVPNPALHPVPIPKEMTKHDIAEITGAFASAARRCVEADVDMILLHGGHGYLLCSFLSPYSNHRTDEYGGSAEHRGRFPLEVLAAVRDVVGPDYPVGYRLSAVEFIEGGLTLEETIPFCQRLAAAGVDLIDVSGGMYETTHMMIQGPEMPKGGFVPMAAAIKRTVGDGVPVSVTQRMNDPQFANAAMEREGFDYVSLTRAFHADPHYVRKVEEDRVEDILPCIACHKCLNLFVAGKVAHCATNPHSTFERARRIQPAPRARRVLIVGGGPGGMQAARILARQGHKVTLYEAQPELGGQLRYSARGAEDYGYLVPWLTRQLDKLGVEVKLACPVDVAVAEAANPEVVVIATGARAGHLNAPIRDGLPQFDVFSAFDRPDDEWEDRVAIIGGDFASCFLALYIAGRGAETHLIDPAAGFALDKESPARDLLVATLEQFPLVHLHAETTVEEVGAGYLQTQRHGEIQRLGDIGSVVVGGRVAENALFEQLSALHPEWEIYNIGDSVAPRLVYEASHEAAEVAELIRLRSAAAVSVVSADPAPVVTA